MLLMTQWLGFFLVASSLLAAEELPITGLAHVAFKVTDLAQARGFYTGTLGYQEAFQFKDAKGAVTMSFFKINDDQFLEIVASLKPGEDERLSHLALATSDIDKLHRLLTERGLQPAAVQQGRDGNRNFSIKDPDGHRVEFVQYMPGSLHTNVRGKFMDARRISDHMTHTGVSVANLDAAMAFYRDKLGFREIWRGGSADDKLNWINMRMPGPSGDYVEFMLHDKPLARAQLGSMHHICLGVPEIQAPYRELLTRGLPAKESSKPKVGRNKRWLMNLYDPDGTRTELMEPKNVE
jgi:catechol 2,3-dioxygenase-like lactoylglutathione lyase family enzyme